jgi:hypothetical protein
MKKPDFLIAGAARCGTSSLHKSLVQHPDISESNYRVPDDNRPGIAENGKEVHFFDTKYKLGSKWYFSLFTGKYNFESTPNYLYDNRCPKRVREILPDCKFIVMLRNPVDRAYSHYRNWKNRSGYRMDDLKNPEHLIVKKGVYIEQLMRWFQYFPKEQFMIIRSEDFYGNPERIIQDVLHWLDIPFVDIKSIYHDPVNRNQRGPNLKNQQIPTHIRTWLRHYYKPYNELLYQFIDRDMGWR